MARAMELVSAVLAAMAVPAMARAAMPLAEPVQATTALVARAPVVPAQEPVALAVQVVRPTQIAR